jgi:hypothetical protein
MHTEAGSRRRADRINVVGLQSYALARQAVNVGSLDERLVEADVCESQVLRMRGGGAQGEAQRVMMLLCQQQDATTAEGGGGRHTSARISSTLRRPVEQQYSGSSNSQHSRSSFIVAIWPAPGRCAAMLRRRGRAGRPQEGRSCIMPGGFIADPGRSGPRASG